MMAAQGTRCSICGSPVIVEAESIAVTTFKSPEEIVAIKDIICGPCTETETYRTKYFLAEKPHIALAVPSK